MSLMNPYVYKAKIVNVVDGDTVDAVVNVGFKMTSTQRLRLLDVDTAEMNDKDPILRAKALAAKVWMIDQVLNKDVMIKTEKSDVFGRYLAYIYVGERNINEELKQLGLS